VRTCAALGRDLGTAGQLASDCWELFHDPECRDLVHGARTLPIAFYLERLQDAEREAFLALLERAREEDAARQEVRDRLREAGDLRRCAFAIEVRIRRGIRLVGEAGLREPWAGALREMFEGISFFARPERARARTAGPEGGKADEHAGG
jgi:geranylgeranyl pyrophosphate synthase